MELNLEKPKGKKIMKLVISLMTLHLVATANLIVIYETPHSDHGQDVKNIFLKQYEIPEELVKVQKVEFCGEFLRARNALELCINKKELEVLNSSSTIVQSLLVFKSENE